MAQEILNAILAEERQAAQALSQARQDAGETLKEAAARSVERERQAAVEFRALRQRILSEYTAKAEEEIRLMREASHRENQAFADKARAQVSAAAQKIVDEVLDGRR